MPRITLAYPWADSQGQDHKPDETLDVEDAVAIDLFDKGWARPADETPRKGGK